MHTVIRNYTGSPGFADELKKRSKEIEGTLSSVPGFVAYYLVKTSEGATSITVCDSKPGCDESTKRAAAFIRDKMPDTKVNPPHIIEGDLAFRFATYQTKV